MSDPIQPRDNFSYTPVYIIFGLYMQAGLNFGGSTSQSNPVMGSTSQMCVQSDKSGQAKGAVGQPSNFGGFGSRAAAPCVMDQNFYGSNYPVRNGFFFGINNQFLKKNEGTQTIDNLSYIEQRNALENNQCFAKIIENEFFNVPLHLKLDCMQEIIEVIKKFKNDPKNEEASKSS